ncbi:hypothetical protein KR026_010322, partial [Drosophila bipectinata]
VQTVQTYGQSSPTDLALRWAQEEVNTFELIAREKLPPTNAAQSEANDLVDSLKMAVSHCNIALQSSGNLTQHEACVKSVTTFAKSSLGELASEHWAVYGASSGASRIHLFW